MKFTAKQRNEIVHGRWKLVLEFDVEQHMEQLHPVLHCRRSLRTRSRERGVYQRHAF